MTTPAKPVLDDFVAERSSNAVLPALGAFGAEAARASGKPLSVKESAA
jgi:hypothetical protein